jgi:hypothetical protein
MSRGDDGSVDAASLPEHVAPTAPSSEKKAGGGGFFDSLGTALGVGGRRGAKAETDGGFSMMISAPFNVQHNIHVQVDPHAPTGFKGLPPEWDAMLSVSGISKVRGVRNRGGRRENDEVIPAGISVQRRGNAGARAGD